MPSREYTQLVFEGEPNKRQKFSLVSFPGQYEAEWKLITQQERVPKEVRLASSCVFYPSDDSDYYGEHCKPCLCEKLYKGVHKEYDTWTNGQADFGCFWFHRWKSNVDWVADRQVAIIVYKAGLVNQITGLGNSQRGEVAEIRERNLPAVHVDIREFMEHILPFTRTPQALQDRKLDEVKDFLDNLIAEKRQEKLKEELSEDLAQQEELQKQRSAELQEAEENLRRCQEQKREGDLRLTALQEALKSVSADSPQPDKWGDVRTQLEQQGLVGPASLHQRRRQAEAARLQPPAPEPEKVVKQALKNLDQSGKDMSDGMFSEVVGCLPTLCKLRLCGCRLKAAGIGDFCQALKINTSITMLELESNRLGDEGASLVAEALKTNSSLAWLKIGWNRIEDEGARDLGEALKANSCLTVLDIKANRIGDEGVSHLAEALKTNNSLTRLDMCSNEIGPEGACHLGEALKTNNSLTTLYMGHNGIKGEGMRGLAEALKTNSSLTHLILEWNSIKEEGSRHLAEALHINRALTTLDISCNGIGEEGVRHLQPALKANRGLTRLTVMQNDLNDRWKGILDSAASTACTVDA